MNSAQLDTLLSLTLEVAGKPHCLRLRIPLWSETLSAIVTPDLRTPARLAAQLGVRIYDLIAADGDDGRPRLSTVDQWLAERRVAEILVERHRVLVEVTSEAGMVQLGCPDCDAEVELTLGALAIAVGNALPPIFEGPFFALPPLSSWLPRPARAGLRPCRHVRFQLPSKQLGVEAPFAGGFLGELDVDPAKPREAALWRTWALPDDVDPASTRASWTPGCAGFRASIRLTVALDDPRNGAVTPETIAALPLCDVFFLNALYWLTYAALPSQPHALACPRCATTFTPVR
jgi:hypothetical protein